MIAAKQKFHGLRWINIEPGARLSLHSVHSAKDISLVRKELDGHTTANTPQHWYPVGHECISNVENAIIRQCRHVHSPSTNFKRYGSRPHMQDVQKSMEVTHVLGRQCRNLYRESRRTGENILTTVDCLINRGPRSQPSSFATVHLHRNSTAPNSII